MKKISKRKRYVGGGMTPYMQTDFNSQLPTQLVAPESAQAYAPGNYNPKSSANFFQSSTFNNAMGKVNGIAGAADTAMSLIGNMTGPATASTVSESRMQTAMNSIGGALKGASAGMAVGGPVGAIVGGVAGLATGVIGKKGSVTTSKNPYDDQVDVKYGTGIRGGRRNRRKLNAKAQDLREGARKNQASLALGSMNEQDFYSEYDNDIQTMAQGGMINSLAYVDDGELLNPPYGGIAEVPEEGKPTDSNLVSLPEGTRILSDKRKVPGSNETFAQMGKRLMSKKKTTRTDKYAENAAMLNEMNDQAIYNKLFAMQEATKKKQPIQKFKDGGTKRGFQYNPSPLTSKAITSDNLVNSGNWTGGIPYWLLTSHNGSPATPTSPTTTTYSATTTTGTSSTSTRAVTPRKKSTATSTIEPVVNNLDLSGETMAKVPDETAPYIAPIRTTVTNDNTPSYKSTPSNSKSYAIGDFLTDLAALSPTISNMFTKPEQFNAVYNPYEPQVRSTMANRKFDISPAKRAIRENRAVSNYNAANYNPNTGSNLAYRLQSQIAADKAIADLYSTASNVNNQYAADYANALNNLGQQRVQATNMAVDMNAKSRAAARNIQRTALSQLSQYAQNKQLMKNQKGRDMAMLDMFGPFLEAGYKSEDFASFMKKFKKG